MGSAISLIKISGHYLDDDVLLRQFAAAVARRVEQLVIVHGGGIEITRMQERLDIEPRYVDGLRITDAQSLALVEMVLCGSVNKRLVRHLLNAGVDAQGLSGVDRGLIRARQMEHESVDMQFTGSVKTVRGEVLFQQLDLGVTPVIAPVSAGTDSNFNLNADPVSGALAAAIGADSVVFISNVSGVLAENEVVERLSELEARALIANGTIYGGMIPKVETALDVLSSGVPKAIITDLDGWACDVGTTFVH
ncbi:MAG: acetylglutamate kinase [Chloroflexi bacterium]|nr:acetylglutamate kinase [Chloroflexota bacterium]